MAVRVLLVTRIILYLLSLILPTAHHLGFVHLPPANGWSDSVVRQKVEEREGSTYVKQLSVLVDNVAGHVKDVVPNHYAY